MPPRANVELCELRFHVHDIRLGSVGILLGWWHDHRDVHVFRQSDDEEEERGGLQFEFGNVGAAGWSIDVTSILELV